MKWQLLTVQYSQFNMHTYMSQNIHLCTNDTEGKINMIHGISRMPCRETGCTTDPCWKLFLSVAHSSPLSRVWRYSTAGHTSSLIVSVSLCMCVFLPCECALLCQACQMCSCPLEEPQMMRSIRAQLRNQRSKAVMHLMLGVVMETQGADFPLHWLPLVYRHFKITSKRGNWKMGGKISQVAKKMVRRHSKTHNEIFTVTPYN